MKTTQLQINEWIIVPFVAVFVVALGYFMSQLQTNQNKEVSEIKYEMPRPEDEYIGQYSLNGRKVNRQLINPFTQKIKSQEVQQSKVQGLQQNTKVTQKNKSKNKAQGLLNKKQFDVQVVDQTENSLKNEMNKMSAIQRMTQIEKSQTIDKKSKLQNSTVLRSVAQWIDLLTKNPNAENVISLVKSYRQKSIDTSGFYQIINSLFNSDHSDAQLAGLYALQLQPEAQAFQFASRKLSTIEAQSETGQALQIYLLSFNEAQKIPNLIQVLKSKDQIAIAKAVEVLSQFNEKSIQQSRFQQRGQQPDQQQFTQLISYFKSLLNNENETIVSTAQNMLSKLQALVDSATIGT